MRFRSKNLIITDNNKPVIWLSKAFIKRTGGNRQARRDLTSRNQVWNPIDLQLIWCEQVQQAFCLATLMTDDQHPPIAL